MTRSTRYRSLSTTPVEKVIRMLAELEIARCTRRVERLQAEIDGWNLDRDATDAQQ